jgi:hypothetical protein
MQSRVCQTVGGKALSVKKSYTVRFGGDLPNRSVVEHHLSHNTLPHRRTWLNEHPADLAIKKRLLLATRNANQGGRRHSARYRDESSRERDSHAQAGANRGRKKSQGNGARRVSWVPFFSKPQDATKRRQEEHQEGGRGSKSENHRPFTEENRSALI